MGKIAKFIILIVLCSLRGTWHLVKGDCFLKYPPDPRVAPIYKTKFGSKEVTIPFNGDGITLEDNEEITAYCDTTFRFPDNLERASRQRIYIRCSFNNLYYEYQSELYGNNHQIYNVMMCAERKWNIYESETPFPWCERSAGSYHLATSHNAQTFPVAGLCFNVDPFAIRSVYIFVDGKNVNLMKEPTGALKYYKIGANIEHSRSFFKRSSSIGLKTFTGTKFAKWFELENFQYSSIIPVNGYEEYFQENSVISDIMWWSNLRLGNWQRFSQALNEHLNNNTYHLFAGVSGAAEAPMWQNCSKSYQMETILDSLNRSIPAYVWTYLKSAAGNEEFVIIGFNSPFYEFYTPSEVVFCDDICHEIEWLEDVRSTFRFTTLGVVFCCSADVVRKSGVFDAFPAVHTLRPLRTFTTPKTFHSASPSIRAELDDYRNEYNEQDLSENY